MKSCAITFIVISVTIMFFTFANQIGSLATFSAVHSDMKSLQNEQNKEIYEEMYPLMISRSRSVLSSYKVYWYVSGFMMLFSIGMLIYNKKRESLTSPKAEPGETGQSH